MKNILLILFTGFTSIFTAQNTLSGTITDADKQALPGVSIYVPKIEKGTETNLDGHYELNNLPNGTLTVVFSFMGYKTVSRNIDFNGNPVQLDLSLEESVFKMDEVIVSTPFNKLQSENVMKVEHKNIDLLQRKGAATLIDGLTSIAGVSQVSTGTSIGKPVIRGLSGNRVLVYTQGVRLENQQFGEEHGLGLNDAGIESVEVIKGPASLLYGSDALGGVIYFNPEKFAAPNTTKFNVNQKYFSNTLGSNTSVGLKTSTDNWSFLARGSYDMHSDYKIPDGERVTNTRYKESDLKAGIGYNNAKFSSVLRYNFNKLDLGIPEDGIGEQTKSKYPVFPRQGVNSNLLSLNNNIYFKDSKAAINLGYIANDRKEFEDSNNPVLHMKLKTFNYDVKYHLPKLGNFEAIAGIQGMHQTNKNSGEEFLIPNATTDDYGLFGTVNYEWKSNVIQAGLRFDNRNITTLAHGTEGEEGYFAAIDRSFNSFNTSIGYKTDLADDLSLRLNVATGFRAPNLAELTSNGVHEGTNRYEIGNNTLKTEQNIQTDFNLEYTSDHFEFYISSFYNHVNNYIYISPTGTDIEGFDVYDYVQNNAKLYGGEVGLHLHPHPLDWLHLESNFETVTGKKENGDYLPLIPANNWQNTLRGEFDTKDWLSKGYASLNLSSTFKQDHVSGFETASKGYTLLNYSMGGTVTLHKATFNVTFNINNIFDKKYIAHLSRLKTDGIPNIGRDIILGVNFSI